MSYRIVRNFFTNLPELNKKHRNLEQSIQYENNHSYISYNDRCSCSEYNSEEVCSSMGYCSWIGNTCVDLQCQTVSYADCTAESTMYKCGWSQETNLCQSQSYTCNDITIVDNCFAHYGLDCIWQKSTSKCIPFTCTGIDLDQCDTMRCSNASGVCGPPQTVDCSTLSTSACASGIYGGNGKFCITNDNGVCKSYNEQPKDCSDYSDLGKFCKVLCSQDISGIICYADACSKKKTSYDCNIIIDYYAKTITPCVWTGSQCQDASDADFQYFNIQRCLIYTWEHYAWDWNSQRCVKCTKLSPNPYLNSGSQSGSDGNTSENNTTGNSSSGIDTDSTATSSNNTTTSNNGTNTSIDTDTNNNTNVSNNNTNISNNSTEFNNNSTVINNTNTNINSTDTSSNSIDLSSYNINRSNNGIFIITSGAGGEILLIPILILLIY